MDDPNVEAVRQKLHIRSQRGQAKYGCTTADNTADLLEWLQHLQDELMDGAVYCEAAMRKIREGKADD